MQSEIHRTLNGLCPIKTVTIIGSTYLIKIAVPHVLYTGLQCHHINYDGIDDCGMHST